jgi:hypothetical protein
MKKLFIFLLLINLLSGCESARDSFSLKKSNTDEFLVEKKNPLVMPPNYDDLPKPEDFELPEKKREDEFRQVIESTKRTNSEIKNKKTTLEESVLEKIN